MRNSILTTLLILLIGSNTIQAQIIEQFSIDGFWGFSNLHASNSAVSQLDFMNSYRDNDLLDDGYISGACHFWFRNGWETNIEAGYFGDIITPNIFDFRLLIPAYNQLKVNVGFEYSVLLVGFGPDYIQQLPEFQTHTIEQYNDNYSVKANRHDRLWYGPYLGLNYSKTKNRWLFKGDINTGVFFNNAQNVAIVMKEKESNAVKKQVYHLKSTGSIWIKPEAYISFAAINAPKLQIGVRAKVELFLAAAGINYQLRNYNWTWHNPIISDHIMPKHLVRDINADFGIYLLLK